MSDLADGDYRRLLAFRNELRRFLDWSEQAASGVGITAAQHQLLLAVRGHPGSEPPTVGEVALALRVRHHSAVELAQRAAASGLLLRERDRSDQRRVRLRMTQLGHETLDTLTAAHLPRIAALAATLDGVVGREAVARPLR